MQVCDIAYKRCSNFDAQKPRVFTLLFVFLSNFIDLIVQNVFISRKLIWIIAKCLNEYKNCYELQCGYESVFPLEFTISLIVYNI